jgi:hypothetical protein
MLSSPLDKVNRMGQKLYNGLQRLARPTDAPRKVDDELSSSNPGDATRKSGPHCFFQSLGAHHFRKPWDLPLDHSPCGLGRDVTRAEPCPASGENGVATFLVRPVLEPLLNLTCFIRQDFKGDNLPTVRLKNLLERRTGPVFALAMSATVAQYKYLGAKR